MPDDTVTSPISRLLSDSASAQTSMSKRREHSIDDAVEMANAKRAPTNAADARSMMKVDTGTAGQEFAHSPGMSVAQSDATKEVYVLRSGALGPMASRTTLETSCIDAASGVIASGEEPVLAHPHGAIVRPTGRLHPSKEPGLPAPVQIEEGGGGMAANVLAGDDGRALLNQPQWAASRAGGQRLLVQRRTAASQPGGAKRSLAAIPTAAAER